jgi:hypothetical protein
MLKTMKEDIPEQLFESEVSTFDDTFKYAQSAADSGYATRSVESDLRLYAGFQIETVPETSLTFRTNILKNCWFC